MQVGLLRCSHYAQTRRPIAKALVALNGTRTIMGKSKPWSEIKQRSRLLVFNQNSHPRVNSAIILMPPSESIVESVNNRRKSLEEAEETLDASSPPLDNIPPIPTRRFHANPPLHYTPRKPKDAVEERVQNTFSMHTVSLLRHTARAEGFRVLPDGFVRVADILRYDEFYKAYNFELFAKLCQRDPARDLDLVHMPDFIDGELKDIWWVRARRAHTMAGVDCAAHRILNTARLKTLVCLCDPKDSDNIRKNGIPEREYGHVRLYRTLENALFETMHFPSHQQHLCVSIDSEVAARMGVMFFMTSDLETYAVGNPDKIVPPQALLGATLLDLSSKNLLFER